VIWQRLLQLYMTLAQALCHKFTCCFLHLYAKMGQTTDRS